MFITLKLRSDVCEMFYNANKRQELGFHLLMNSPHNANIYSQLRFSIVSHCNFIVDKKGKTNYTNL